MARRTKSSQNESKADAKPLLEWVASSVGLLIALGLIAVLGWNALRQHTELPTVTIETGRISEHQGGYTIELRARNAATATAADVQIEGVLRRGEQVVEVARMRLDFLPGNSARRGGLFFTRDPRQHALSVRALGYADP